MDDARTARQIERESADALLDAGVSVPLLECRVPFRKKPLVLRVTLRRPRLGGLMAIAREWLGMGVTAEELWHYTKEEELRFVAEHGRALSRMVAFTFCRGCMSRRFLVRPVAWAVREWMHPHYMASVMKHYVLLLGTDPFLSIIVSGEALNVMKPRTSRVREGS